MRYGLFFEAIAQVELRQMVDNVRDGKTGSASWWKKWDGMPWNAMEWNEVMTSGVRRWCGRGLRRGALALYIGAL